jgi:23S rRNA pseudouridine1911/1915/1917 synthase
MIELKIIYEDNDILAVDKPAGMVVFDEIASSQAPRNDGIKRRTVIDALVEKYPELKNVGEAPRYGVVHRLDKDTSGVLLVAKTNEALLFLQKQFSLPAEALRSKAKEGAGKSVQPLEKRVEKRYIALVEGNIENERGTIHTLIARAKGDPRKQRAYSPINAPTSAREAITEYKVLERFKDYTLLEVEIKTGRRHQIRCHFSYLKHPIAGDKMYGFKNSKIPEGLTRQFLHAQRLKIQLPARNASHSDAGGPNGQIQEFISDLPEDLKKVLNNLVKE